ncbi:MAG: hypothetical protein KKA19_01025, partial [Candidatus Margulisbacteria bacterium]|nr:hypothetical protein [Candidatus Margulisiibacteriota bacterium]
MVKIALFANGPVGVEVAKFLVKSGDVIEKLYLHEKEKQANAQEIIKAAKISRKKVFLAKDVLSKQNIAAFKKVNIDFIITVYWAYLLKPIIYQQAKKGTLNFHPALLPINRGWYPHVHSLIDGTPFGVTLHVLEETADTGPIWVQKQVFPEATDTAGDVYAKLQKEIIHLFKKNWLKIKNGEIKPIKQDETKALYRKKLDIKALDKIDLEKTYKAKELINILRARSFNNKGFAYFL